MNPLTVFQMLTIGLVAGTAGGMFGIGGGLIMVPALMIVAGQELKLATGTSLAAQLLPVALFAVMEKYRLKEVDFRFAGLMAVGLLAGTLLGVKLSTPIDKDVMKKLYGGFLLLVGIRYLFFK